MGLKVGDRVKVVGKGRSRGKVGTVKAVGVYQYARGRWTKCGPSTKRCYDRVQLDDPIRIGSWVFRGLTSYSRNSKGVQHQLDKIG